MCALVTGVQTCALPISLATVSRGFLALMVLVLASPAWAASTADAPLAPVLEPLLAGEFYLQQGDYPRAAEQYLAAAQQSLDPAVARRATAAALARISRSIPASRPNSASAVAASQLDRKSVVSGPSVSVRVDHGGRRMLKKK